MFKKTIGVALVAVMAAGMMTACGSSSSDSASSSSTDTTTASTTSETGIEDGVLTVGFDAEYPPYGYMDDNG